MNDCIHYENITYDSCRDCGEDSTKSCQHYLPYHNRQNAGGQHSEQCSADTFELLDVLEDGTDPNQYILMMARANKTKGRRFLYKDLQDWIRRNDRSAI